MIGLLVSVLPGLLKWVSSSALNSWVEIKKAEMNSTTKVEQAKITAQVRTAELELERRKLQMELQTVDLASPWFRFFKNAIVGGVCLYWATRFFVKTIGLDDYNVAISDLSVAEATVSSLVISYLFLTK